MFDKNELGFCSKKQRTLGHLLPPTSSLLDFSAYGKLIDSIILLGETFNNYTLPDGRILGLVIDLNSRNCDNNGLNIFTDEIRHIKIPCHDSVVPSNESVNLFVHEIRKFVHQNQNKYVLVHMINGYNHIGYMIVHYLMRTRLISVTQAIQIFADVRPPGILNSEYINSLYTFYHEIIKPEASLTLNGNSKQQQEMMKNNDVIGDSIPTDQEYDLRNICYALLKLPNPNAGVKDQERLQFPGTHPVPLNKENIEVLKQRCYYASWKAKGNRYMMLIAIDGCYLIDTQFNFRRVQMRFPSSIANKSHHLTLLDGEMIIDNMKKTGKQIRRYLVTDIMAINSISLVDREFHERWDIIEKDVIEPRRNDHNNDKKLGYRFDLEPFRVRRKNYWCLSTVPNLLTELIPNLSHESGGLIFQGWKDPYIPYTNKSALKWRNAEKDTVCFLYEVVDEEDHLLYVHEEGEKIFVAANRIVFGKNFNSPSENSEKKIIIECYWDDEQKMWICVRIRSDINNPDEFSKYLEVARRILENVNDEMLVNEICKIHISQPNFRANEIQSHFS